MKWHDISMVNLRRREDGGWSYTAYLNDFTVFRTNNCPPDVWACVLEINAELKHEERASGGTTEKTRSGLPGGKSVHPSHEGTWCPTGPNTGLWYCGRCGAGVLSDDTDLLSAPCAGRATSQTKKTRTPKSKKLRATS